VSLSSPAPGERCDAADDDLSCSSPSTRSALTPSASCVNSASAESMAPGPRHPSTKRSSARQICRQYVKQKRKATGSRRDAQASKRGIAARTRHGARRTVLGSIGRVEVHIVVDAGNPALKFDITIGRRPTQRRILTAAHRRQTVTHLGACRRAAVPS